MQLLRIAAALLAVLPEPFAQEPAPTDPTVLLIDGVAILRSAYADWLLASEGEALAPAFALDRAVHAQAARLDITLAPEEVRASVEAEIDARITGAYHGDRSRYAADLAKEGRSERGRLVERIQEREVELLLEAIARSSRVIPEGRVRELWERRLGPGGQRIDARVCLLALEIAPVPGETREEQRRRRQAREASLLEEAGLLRAQLLAGGDFGELARSRSDDAASRSRDGEPSGGLDPRLWPREAWEIIATTPPGTLTAPLLTPRGVWLVEVRGSHTTPLAEVEAALRAELAAGPLGAEEVALVRAGLARGRELVLYPALFAPPFEGALGPRADETVLGVAGVEIDRSTYGLWLLRDRGEVEVRAFVREFLLARAAEARGVTIDPELLRARVDQEIDRTIQLFHAGDRGNWLAKLAAGGVSEEAFRRELARRERRALCAERLVQSARTASEEDLRAAWERAFGRGGRSHDLAWIRIDVRLPARASGSTEEQYGRAVSKARDAARERALDLARRARGGEDFAALAGAESDDPETRPRGGSAPEGFRAESWPDPLVAAVRELARGEISEPIASGDSFFVLRLVGVREVPFHAVREQLRLEHLARPVASDEIAALEQALAASVSIDVRPELVP